MSTLVTITFLILLNGFFSLSEMAIVSSRRAILKEMLKKGNNGAQRVIDIIDNKSKFLSSVQVGITAVAMLAATYGGATIAHSFSKMIAEVPAIGVYAESISLTIVVAFLTYFSVVIGELIPKRIALKDPEMISIFIAGPMLFFSKIFSPIVILFDFSANVVLKFFGISTADKSNDTEEELKAIINEGVQSGEIEKSEHEMMHRIFRLDDRDAKSIMTHVGELVCLRIDDNQDEIKRRLGKSSHSRYPVIESESKKVLGIVQVKDLLTNYVLTGKIDLESNMKPPYFISENTNCLKVLEMFKASSINLAIVVDEYGQTEGVVSGSDIFEAIVGVIPGHYDEKDEVMIVKNGEDSWLVEGITPIDEISIVVGIEEINLDEKYDTIAGFVADKFHDNFDLNSRFSDYGYEFIVKEINDMKIDKILIQKIKEKDQED